MDREEIRYLLGSTIYARAKAYENRVQNLECETAENGVRHLSADVRGSGRNLYRTQAWLRQNGSFVSASCTCSFNENGEGPCCKHIGALLLHEVDEPEEKVAAISKELLHWTDTYVLDIADPEDALYVLMFVLAIDAEKCSRN